MKKLILLLSILGIATWAYGQRKDGTDGVLVLQDGTTVKVGEFDSGVYTPTFANHTNLDNTTMADLVGFLQVGDTVFLFGIFRIDATSAGNFSFEMSYPPGLTPRTTNNPDATGSSSIAFGNGVGRNGRGSLRLGGTVTEINAFGDVTIATAEFMTFSIKYFVD